ncbi:virulence factor Mce family protein [Mycolicibacterium vulneris]|uniref:virulence factor Mce family protein n=1 Tax=Mycolicibacterium vulneris TaxID=547163 RepID=UPI0026B69731
MTEWLSYLRQSAAAAVRHARLALATTLSVVLAAGVFAAMRASDQNARVTVVAYFDNSSGVFPGDDVRIRGVPVGKVEKIEPQPLRSKITFWFDRHYKVPADAKAAILSPQLVTGRAIQLTPPYTHGPTMGSGATIPQDRTAVPVEWDEVRAQLERLTDMLQPTKPGGVSTLGELINSGADNLRGQGANIRDTVIKLSQAVSALGDHSKDIFGTVKNLSVLVTALRDSSGLLSQLNNNLASASSLLADDPNKVSRAVEDLNAVVGDVQSFIADNREAVGTASDKLTSISTAVVGSLDDIKQTLHIAPTPLVNLYNIYEPANGALTGALQINNFANPLQFFCGAIQAASRLGAEQASKLCVQYLAPIMKTRQYNFPPIGEDLFVGAQARPNEVTYSENWMRPDYVPPAAAPTTAPPPAAGSAAPSGSPPLPAEAPPQSSPTVPTNPAAGLSGMMVPPGAGS